MEAWRAWKAVCAACEAEKRDPPEEKPDNADWESRIALLRRSLSDMYRQRNDAMIVRFSLVQRTEAFWQRHAIQVEARRQAKGRASKSKGRRRRSRRVQDQPARTKQEVG